MLKFYHQNLQHINEWIKLADNKTNFLIALYTAIIVGLLVQVSDYIKIAKNCSCSALLVVITFFLMLTLFLIGKSFWHFYRVINPRVEPNQYIKDIPQSNIFWGDIASVKFDEFRTSVEKINIDDLFEDIIRQVYINSRISTEKFDNVKSAYYLVLPTLLCLVISTIFLKIGG